MNRIKLNKLNLTPARQIHDFVPYGQRYGPATSRAANSGITATVFGSTGFTGRYVMNQLGNISNFI